MIGAVFAAGAKRNADHGKMTLRSPTPRKPARLTIMIFGFAGVNRRTCRPRVRSPCRPGAALRCRAGRASWSCCRMRVEMICGGGGGSGSSTGGGAGGTAGFGLTTRRFGFAGRGAFASDAGSAATTVGRRLFGVRRLASLGAAAGTNARRSARASAAETGCTPRARERQRDEAARGNPRRKRGEQHGQRHVARDGQRREVSKGSSPRAEKPRREKPPVITKAPCFRAACLGQIAAVEPGRIDM